MLLEAIISNKTVLSRQQLTADKELIKQVQIRLQALGYYGGAIDSIWGPKTEGAIAFFCDDHHLDNERTGKYGATWAKALLEAKVSVTGISPRGIDLIAEFEGCRLHAYLDAVGVATIGYGHTKGVRLGQSLPSIQAAKELLMQDLNTEYVPGVKACLKVPVNQNQLDALVSFTYNCGVGALQTSALLRCVNARDWHAAANQFMNWTHAGGEVLPGLVRRRTAERRLFLS